ncbi:MAG: phosphoribosylformylglycinamidine cyclo-ligase [Chloroflexi bacterium]|nr:MAG: phosphoribosylformylglycinamidine cyclo-ligase [Chloroflexota bacterium]
MERRAAMTTPRALVLRAPGINCDRETAHACRQAGFATDLLHINQLIKQPQHLLDYHLLVIPGGFSYGDDLGAGTLLAKNITIHLGTQLQQFIDQGRLILGICNGFQALVRAGLLPDPASTCASLTNNASAQFECRWITLSILDSPCIFTRGIDHPIQLPVAHGEGQFVLADPELLSQLQADNQVPIVYTINTRQAPPSPATHPFSSSSLLPYPDNPNGSTANIAGICNARGTVFGLMPHPERYIHPLQHPQRLPNHHQADGLLIFHNAYTYAQTTLLGTGGDTYHCMGGGGRGGGSVDEGRAPLRSPSGVSHTPNSPLTYTSTSYASSGVNIAAADTAKELMRDAVRAAQGPQVLAGMGAFAGVIQLDGIHHMRQPALVASTDGVGTKTLIAAQARRFDTIGYDLVNHSVNDLLTQGAKPLFFMDYLAMGRLDAVQAARIVSGVANACREVGCALLGGETAEMPDVYLPGAFDLAGTIVGIVEQESLVNPDTMDPGDIILGFPSSGLHTNGYSLARRVFSPYPLDTVFPELGEPLVDALLRPHRCYLREILTLRVYPGITIKGMAHITGGGFEGNISRILPPGIQAVIETNAWHVPPIFDLLERMGNVPRGVMYHALNMGIGMALVVSPKAAIEARRIFPELLTIGHLTEGKGVILS